jgi:hypothetical protein
MSNSLVVISRYNEDVSWSRNVPHKIIYNKGDRSSIPTDLHEYVIDLPNIGREAHTYLTYIVANYDNLPDVVVFTQGRYNDHYGGDIKTLFNIDSCSKNYQNSAHFGQYAGGNYNFRITHWHENLTPTKYNESYGQWYERLVSTPFPPDHRMYVGAIFSVTRDRIHKHSLAFYTRLLQEGDFDSRSPESAHFMERTWTKLFLNPL